MRWRASPHVEAQRPFAGGRQSIFRLRASSVLVPSLSLCAQSPPSSRGREVGRADRITRPWRLDMPLLRRSAPSSQQAPRTGEGRTEAVYPAEASA
jgi:hypothetical protein